LRCLKISFNHKPQKDKTAELEYLRFIEMKGKIGALIWKVQKDLDTKYYVFTNNKVQWIIDQLKEIINE